MHDVYKQMRSDDTCVVDSDQFKKNTVDSGISQMKFVVFKALVSE